MSEKKTYEEALDISDAVLSLTLYVQMRYSKTAEEHQDIKREADEIVLRTTGWTQDEITDKCCGRLSKKEGA